MSAESEVLPMGIYLNPGNQSFRESVRSKIYVDKTDLIACTNEMINTDEKFVCVSRPRRFGKSMTLIFPKQTTFLAEALERIYAKTEKQFIFLIDEWDCVRDRSQKICRDSTLIF